MSDENKNINMPFLSIKDLVVEYKSENQTFYYLCEIVMQKGFPFPYPHKEKFLFYYHV